MRPILLRNLDSAAAMCYNLGDLPLGARGMQVETEYLVVLVTVATTEAGVQMGRQLVEERLAACVQVLAGGTAIYRWQDELYVEPQVQLIIKTSGSAWQRLAARVLELHPDEVPEILALPVREGLPAYLSWLNESTAASAGS